MSSTTQTTSIRFDNPLGYDNVNGLLASILNWLQGILAMLAIIFIVIGGLMYITSGGDSNRTETAKKIITAAVVGFALALAAPSFLKEISTILGWGPTDTTGLEGTVGTSLTFLQILTNTLNFLLSVVGVIAIIMLVVGGVLYITSAGDQNQADRAKKLVTYAVIGIIAALSALVLVTQLAKLFV